MGISRGHEDQRPRPHLVIDGAHAQVRAPREAIVELVLGVRLLEVLGAAGQPVEADAQVRGTQELAIPLAVLSVLAEQGLEIEAHGPPCRRRMVQAYAITIDVRTHIMKTLAERLFVQSVSYPVMSRGMARIADWRMPRPLLQRVLRSYIRFYGVDMAEVEQPLESFPTFNDFFTRKLREGARPVAADPGVVVAPCDSLLATLGAVPPDGRIEQVKGRTYPVPALLGSEEDAAPFVTGVHS